MTARWVQGDPRMAQGFPVLTAQAVATFDMVGLSSGTIVRASDTAWASLIGTPAAPTVTNGAVAVGSPLTNALTAVKISYQFPWGEGALSAAGTAIPTANAVLFVSGASLVPPAPALWTNIYVETAAGSGVFKLWDRNYTGDTVPVAAYGTGQAPASSPVNSGALDITQYNFAQIFLGASNQTKIGGNAFIFGNSLDQFGNITMMIIRGPGAIMEFDCAAATFNVGDYVGPAKDTGNALLNQKVVAVAGEALAIGRVCTFYSSNTTKVCVELLSRYVADLTKL